MVDVTFSAPDLDGFCGLDLLGLTVTGQLVGDDRTVLTCRVVEPDGWCRRCGAEGEWHDTVARELAHVPLGWRPTILRLRVRRWRCTGCGHVWRQDTTAAAEVKAKLSRHAVLWALKSLVIDRLSIARIAGMLAVSWHTVNTAVLAAGHQLLIADPARLDGVRVLGVDEHAWRHTRHGDRYVTVVIDLTPVRDGTGPARLLGHRPGPLQAGVHRLAAGAKPRGSETGSRWWRWTGSPDSRPPPPTSYPTRRR